MLLPSTVNRCSLWGKLSVVDGAKWDTKSLSWFVQFNLKERGSRRRAFLVMIWDIWCKRWLIGLLLVYFWLVMRQVYVSLHVPRTQLLRWYLEALRFIEKVLKSPRVRLDGEEKQFLQTSCAIVVLFYCGSNKLLVVSEVNKTQLSSLSNWKKKIGWCWLRRWRS